MIIGINGKIGSGKDTIGKIIQYLMANPEIKEITTLEEWLDSDDLNGRDFTWKIKKFAGKLKTIASLLTGIPVDKFEDQEFKKTNLESSWDVKSKYRDRRPPTPMTVRDLLQKLGTEAMRDGLHTNVWVNALFADYIHTKNCGCEKNCRCEHDLPNWIITDLRFPNEMEAVEKRHGITIRVVRPEVKDYFQLKNRDGSITHVTLHSSETALDDAEFDYEIINNGTIADLVEKVREILINEKLL